MVLNKRGQLGIILGIMFFVTALIVSIITYPVIKDLLNTAINPSNLDCDNTSISPSTLATCLAVDLIPFGYFVTVIAVGLGAIVVFGRSGGG